MYSSMNSMNSAYQSKHEIYSAQGLSTRPMSGGSGDGLFGRRQHQRMNFVAACQCVFVPWILFCLVFGVVSFDIHFHKPMLCWLLVGAACLVVLGIGRHALAALRAKWRHDESNEPTWYVFLFITAAISVIVAVILGDQVFSNFMQRYYDYLNLNDYSSINVSTMRGQQLMDGARLNFVNGTSPDLRKAIGFQNLHTYCVAPLSIADPNNVRSELASYDFWAVGIDCCSGDNTDFHCGEYNNPKALAGLRLLEDSDRAYYRLAVQQAEAMYHIKAEHPLFLYWTADPVQEMQSWKQEGYKFFYLGMLVHFFWQLFVVSLAVAGFEKMGNFA